MIKFRISILLGFSLLPKLEDKNEGKGKKENKGKEKKEKNTKPSKKGKDSKKNKKEVVEVKVEKPKNLIEVGNPVGFSHIEYELIPGRPKYQIDVICWGPIAKVFSSDGEITLKTFVKNEIAWVPVCVEHVLNHLSDVEVFKLHSHLVNYTICTNKKKLGNRAKSENTKAFFIREEDIDSSQKFTEAYNTNPNLEKCEDEKDKRIKDLNKEIKNIVWECADVPGTQHYDEIVTRLQFLSDPLHYFQVNKIIDLIINGKEVECKDLVPVCPRPLTDADISKQTALEEESKKRGNISRKEPNLKKSGKESNTKKEKKNKKEKKEKPQSTDTLKIVIPGEVFYTDPNISIYDLKTTSSVLTHGFILTTAEQLLSRLQKYSFNPLIIKIKKLSNLPVDLLAKHRFKGIYVYYSVPYIAQCSTIEKPLAKNIRFNEAHAYFTKLVPKLKLLEFMQSQRLRVEIRGVREETENSTEANLFGYEEEDKHISKRLTARQCLYNLKSNKQPGTVTLAVACYNLSSLIAPTWDFLENVSCHHPDNMTFQNVTSMYENFKLVDAITVNEINLGLEFQPKSMSPLNESLLLNYGTTLKLEAYLNAPHNAFLEVHTFPDIYRRLFIIINYEEVAMTLLNEVMLHNQDILGPEIIVSNFLKCNTGANVDATKSNSQKSSQSSVFYAEALTGFMIDNGSTYAFFLEGIANGFIRDIWNQIMDAHHHILKTFYNSDFCFEKRLYTEFFKFGGIYTINLKLPLEQILNQCGIYLEGNVPIPCWQALKKLSLLFKCASLCAMNQYCMFPTPSQLMSLDIEFGVSLKWKMEKNSETEKPLEKTESFGQLSDIFVCY
ncbi:hypothetical protein ILUMI_08276 [Ignelater luminosus]|uniref:DUF4550 domain-containing protein n=1 Tax=Ignelater luminosus TaxID=2038154 RepID=A0A8K0D6L0_IGNLU|nr:hypothetical protein ILUMI_08276 [Ignelater luminosus]